MIDSQIFKDTVSTREVIIGYSVERDGKTFMKVKRALMTCFSTNDS
jgi:hypothetical protein